MKLCILIYFFLLIFQNTALTQSTFNKRFHFGFPSAVLTSLVSSDSGYYSIGIISDSIAPFQKSNIFVKFDLEGNPVLIKTLRDTIRSYETWRSTLIKTKDGNFAAAGYSLDTILRGIIIKYAPNGDTIFTNSYLSYFYPNSNFIFPKDFIETPDSGFLSLNWIRNPEGINNAEISISKLDKYGNTEWQKPFGSNYWDDPLSITKVLDGYVIGNTKSNINFTNQNFIFQSHLFKIDGEGNLMWQYFSPNNDLLFGANGIIPTEDGNLIILSGKGVEVPVNANTGDIRWENYVYSLNANRHFKWGTSLRDSFPVGSDFNSLNAIIPLPQNEGYLAAGNIIDSQGNTFEHKGLLFKLAPNGDSVWARYYTFLDVEETSLHYLYDLEPTSDGGFIMCGQSRDILQTSQGQQAWLIKVDEHGCLVPGCHLTSDLTEAKPIVNLTIYPNPTSDYLNVFVPNLPAKKTAMRLLNIKGQEIKCINSVSENTTYIIPINDWGIGTYILQWLDENGNSISNQKFIVN